MYFAEIGVQVNHAVAELFHILSQQLISVGNPVIQVSHLVVGVSSKMRGRNKKNWGKRGPEIMTLVNKQSGAYFKYSSYRCLVSLSRKHSFSSFSPNFRKLFTRAIYRAERHLVCPLLICIQRQKLGDLVM